VLCSPRRDEEEGLQMTPRSSHTMSMPARSRPRRSLSEWYQVQTAESDGYCSSPSKRRLSEGHSPVTIHDSGGDSSSFFIGDDAEDGCGGSPLLDCDSGNTRGSDDHMKAALRSMCAEYFENNISPMLRYIQQAQEGLNLKLHELREALDQKVNVDSVPTAAQIEASISREVARKTDGVATLVRLQELAVTMQRKADVTSVPSLAQLKGLAERVDLKANTTFVNDQLEILTAVVTQKADSRDVLTISELKEVRAQPFLAAGDCPEGAEGSTLSLKKYSATKADEANLKKIQVVVAAAAARFDKQLRDLRGQMGALRDEVHGAGDRWPGRMLNSLAAPTTPRSDGGSESAMSFTASGVGSDSFSVDERVELKKIQTVVAAAGTAFSRDMREVRKQVYDLRSELSSVKGLLNANASVQS